MYTVVITVSCILQRNTLPGLLANKTRQNVAGYKSWNVSSSTVVFTASYARFM